MTVKKQLFGFARMSPERRRQIGSLAGKRAHELGEAHQFSSEEARQAVLKRWETHRKKKKTKTN